MALHEFFSVVDDPSVFQFQDFNLFKIFYARYVNRTIDRSQHNAPNTHIERSSHIGHSFYCLTKALLVGVRSRLTKGYILFYGATGRHVEINGENFDVYNAPIVAAKGRNHIIIVEDSPEVRQKQHMADFYLSDLQPIISLLEKLIGRFIYNRIARQAYRIVEKYPQLGLGQHEVISVIINFYTHYLVYSFFVKLLHPDQMMLICHYGREKFIAAAKQNNVPITELMHGVITPDHMFYNYPKSYAPFFLDSLFPDKLAVFGEYWKEIVVNGNMLPADAVVVVGYYLQSAYLTCSNKTNTMIPKHTILIATQWTLQHKYLEYIRFLKDNLCKSQWQVIIKPHPAENQAAYELLAEDNFIVVTNESVYKLLDNADILISIYSTVLYEAMLYDVCTYVLIFEEIAERSMEIVNDGIGKPLKSDQLPTICSDSKQLDIKYYFAPFQPELLFK